MFWATMTRQTSADRQTESAPVLNDRRKTQYQFTPKVVKTLDDDCCKKSAHQSRAVNTEELMPWSKLEIISGKHFEYLTDDDGRPRLLGYGSYGDVYLARDIKSQNLVAMKLFRRQAATMKVVFREAAYSCVLSKNDCAPKFYGLVRVNASAYYQPLALAVEFVGSQDTKPCDLARLMTLATQASCGGHGEDPALLLTPGQWIRLLMELAKELHRCHSTGIVLVDLKEDNVLVRNPEAEATPLLADFSLAVHNRKHLPNFGRGQLDTPEAFWEYPHYAPELSDTHIVSPAADIYSFGCILRRVGGVVLGGRVPSLMYLAADCTARTPSERPCGNEVISRLKKLNKVFARRSLTV